MTQEQLRKIVKEPKHKLGDVVIVCSQHDPEKLLQGVIFSADFTGTEWFYGIKAMRFNEEEQIWTYEVNTGDAKTKLVSFPF